MKAASGSFHRRAARVSYLNTVKVTTKPSKSRSYLEIQTARSNQIVDEWRTYLSQGKTADASPKSCRAMNP